MPPACCLTPLAPPAPLQAIQVGPGDVAGKFPQYRLRYQHLQFLHVCRPCVHQTQDLQTGAYLQWQGHEMYSMFLCTHILDISLLALAQA